MTQRGFLGRMAPVWRGNEILRHVHPIRDRARKVARMPFIGSAVVAASVRIEKAGMPQGYRLSETARQYALFQDCEQTVVTLASRVGDPKIAPVPPLWPLLAMILFEWQNDVSANDVLARAASMGLRHEVRRGLLSVTYLFPELQDWLAGVPMGIPFWERALAVPLSVRKLVLLEKTS